MAIQIVKDKILSDVLAKMAHGQFGDFVKAVVDVRLGIMAIGGELHADEESALLARGSRQEDLWGINIYPQKSGDERIVFNSMINIRPSQGNRSRGVESAEIREKIRTALDNLIG